MKRKWGDIVPSTGYQYWIDSGIAWIPMYCQGTLIFLQRYWKSWPEKDGKIILAEDVVPELKDKPLGKDQMYLSYFPYDPSIQP